MADGSAPAVVAVVVTRNPGLWLEETLGALAGQDYPQLVVIVVGAGGEDPTTRISRIMADAFVRRTEEPLPFGRAANEVLGMVEGAAFFLLLHDDCAPDPSAVRLLVEESFRSNAAVVSPKMVGWDNPLMLVHVGMNADKTGAVVDRVKSPEIDHGQHDGVREVFVAPSGCTLVRADLLTELGGYDEGIVAMAEDLDLSWRAQVAGARVIVAPDARVRHMEVIAPGIEPVLTGADADATLQALQRRHELRTVVKCYSGLRLLAILPQIAALNLGEILVALIARDRGRAKAVADAWRWNLAHRGELLSARQRVQAARVCSDKEIRRNQIRGSARLSEYVSNVSHLGFEATHARVGALGGDERKRVPELTGSIAGAFSEDDSFDEDWDDRGRFALRRPRRSRVLASQRSRLVAGLVIAVFLVVGVRNLLSDPLPAVGQFLPLGSWSATWHQFFASWHSAGVGTTAPASPAFAAWGVLGTVFLGAMGFTQKVLVFGCLPLGAWGVSRLLAPFGSRRGQLFGAVAYLGLPLVYNAMARGRLDAMVAFALVPWVTSALMRVSALDPMGGWLPRGGRWPLAQLLGLGALVAFGIAFAPAMVVDVLLVAAGLGAGSLLSGLREAGRSATTAIGAIVVALALCAPWVIGVALSGSHVMGVLGLPSARSSAVGWSALLRFDVGPVGGSGLSWLLPAAALLPVLIGTGPRLAWAARLWMVAIMSYGLGLVVDRGWAGSFAPSLDVVLVPAAVAVAACVGLGVVAFERDLIGHRFGWRQLATSLTMLVAAFGLLPVAAEVTNGSFGLPATGFDASLGFISARPDNSYRVLWLGDPAALPMGAWSVAPGLAYATTEDSAPMASDLYAPASPGPASQLAAAVDLAREGKTVDLGRLLAPAAIRYVVVVESLAPSTAGTSAAKSYPVPANLVPALDQQGDLRQVPGEGGFLLYDNTAALPQRAARAGGFVRGVEPRHGPAAGIVLPSSGDLEGWHPALDPVSGGYRGRLTPGTLYAAFAPSGNFGLTLDGVATRAAPAFSWARQFALPRPGIGTLSFSGLPWAGLGAVLELVVWLAIVVALVDRRLALRARVGALAAARPSETTLRKTMPEPEEQARRPTHEQVGGRR